ncbi:MAG TPA: hypothetical protein VMY76_00680 [Gemmatimonadales bacterium]|nr:hypothetical protein [Gemmatimonadales bacterium]
MSRAIENLRAQLAAEKARADKAEAGCNQGLTYFTLFGFGAGAGTGA